MAVLRGTDPRYYPCLCGGTDRHRAGKIKGNLYELDYLQHFREVIEKSIPADNYTLIYEHGELTKPAGQYFDGNTDPQLGKFIRFEAQPNDPEALKSILREQQKKRTPHTQGDFQLHIAALHDRRIEAEARRIVENVKGLGEPDSPEKDPLCGRTFSLLCSTGNG